MPRTTPAKWPRIAFPARILVFASMALVASPAQPKFYANAVMLRGYVPAMAAPTAAAASADEDGDAMADAWETGYGLDPSNAADAQEDPDMDGYSNAQEYLVGTDPTDAESRMLIASLADGDDFRLCFSTVVGREYVVEFSDGLPAFVGLRRGSPAQEWTELARVSGDGEIASVQDTSAAPAGMRVYRVRITE